MPQPDFTIRQNDLGEPIAAVLVDSSGAPVDLTDATVVFQLAPIRGGALVVDAAADLGDDAGTVSYTWLDGDTAAAGWFLASWQVTFDGGAVQTFPLAAYTLVQIIGELGQIDQAGADGGGGIGLPDWWVVDRAAKTVTVSFPDDPDGDYVGLTIRQPADFDAFSGIVVLGSSDEKQIAIGIRSDLAIELQDLPDGGSERISTLGCGNLQLLDGQNDDIVLVVAHSNVTDRTNDIVQFYKSDGSGGFWGVNKDGLEYFVNQDGFAGPDDGDVASSSRLHWFDDTEGAPTLRFKHRDSAGNLHSGRAAGLVDDASAFSGIAKPSLPANPTNAQIATVLAALGLVNLT